VKTSGHTTRHTAIISAAAFAAAVCLSGRRDKDITDISADNTVPGGIISCISDQTALPSDDTASGRE